MSKLTLLEIVQDILNDLDSDPVNSINDTPEALQIAQIVKTTFFEISANRNWPHKKRSFQMDSVADSTRPTHLQLPESVKKLEVFNYDMKRSPSAKIQMEKVHYITPEEFLRKSNNLDETKSTVDTVTDFGGITFKIRNDVPPEYWTSFDDDYIVCNSYDSDVESTLQSSNTQCLGIYNPEFTLTDSHIPDLPEEAFPSLLAEAKSQSYLVLRQEVNPKVEERARRQRTWLSRNAWRAKGGIKLPNYGRGRDGRTTQYNNPEFGD